MLNPEIIFLNIFYSFLALETAASKNYVEVEVNDGCIKPTDRSSFKIWQYYTASNSSEAKNSGVMIA